MTNGVRTIKQIRKKRRQLNAPEGIETMQKVNRTREPNGVHVEIRARRRGGASDDWPFDDTADTEHAVARTLERHKRGIKVMSSINDCEFYLYFVFYTKDGQEAQRLIREVMREVAPAYKYKAEVL